MQHLHRVESWQETRDNVARARRLAERYGHDEAHPDDYLGPAPADFEELLKKLK